ncbi:MAG TPA: radical SAM protein [Ktedonobacteraceae bacterium]|nr:radical SAM protein [Ktedonobacteraceae bacterium]
MIAQARSILNMFVLKVAARCNLNCSYCYVYNKEDATWKQRSAIMSEGTFETALQRIRLHCQLSGQKEVALLFHGGEPCLLGTRRFDSWCNKARQVLGDVASAQFMIQSNGTLLSEAWAEVFQKHKVRLGISMDGPQERHDTFRVDHKGRGSYEKVARGLGILREANIPFALLSVIPLGSDPLFIHQHFLSLGCSSISYILPDFSHDTIAPVLQTYGSTPCADFLIPIFDEWWFNGTLDVRITNFWNMAKLILGGESGIDSLGNRPLRFVFIEADGEIEGLDVLRVCKEGLAGTGLNVRNNDFFDIMETSVLHSHAIFKSMPLPDACQACPEQDTCGGGYLPHRYSAGRGFNNASIWCADLLKLFTHIRQRMEVPVEETRRRRQALQTSIHVEEEQITWQNVPELATL